MRNTNSKKKFNVVFMKLPLSSMFHPPKISMLQSLTPNFVKSANKGLRITTSMSISNSIEPGPKTQILPTLSNNSARSSECNSKRAARAVKVRGFAKITNDRRKVRLKRK